MSTGAWRVVLWVLGILALLGVVTMGHASFEKEGIFNWEFLAFLISYAALDKCIRVDEGLRIHG